MTNKQIYQEEAKEITLEFAIKQRLTPEFLLEDAKNKGFVYTLKEVDEYIKRLDIWERRQEIILFLIEYIELDKKTKKAILKNGKSNSSNSSPSNTL